MLNGCRLSLKNRQAAIPWKKFELDHFINRKRKMKKTFLFIFSMLLAATFVAQEVAAPEVESEQPEFEQESFAADWSISVGVSYRDFKNPKFKTATTGAFSGYVLDEATGTFLEPTPANISKAFESRWGNAGDGLYRVSYGSYSGASGSGKGTYGFLEQCAPVIGFSTGVWAKDALDMAFVANFQYFQMDSAYSGSSANGGVSMNDYFVAKIDGTLTPNTQSMPSSAKNSGSVISSAKSKFDMDLYVFDAGLSLGYNFDGGLRAFLAAGPTFSIADMETRSMGSHANETEFNWGLYASLGADIWFTETVGMSGELRYDKGFGSVGTRYVKQSLDTVGCMLKLQFRF